jgi:hypothetical protein
MKWQPLSSRSAIDEFLRRVDWAHAFIREAYLLSPSYIRTEDMGTVAPDALPTIVILITIPDECTPGVEIVFEKVKEVCLWFEGELDPQVNLRHDVIEWRFNKTIDKSLLCAASARVRFHDRTSWGNNKRYSQESF